MGKCYSCGAELNGNICVACGKINLPYLEEKGDKKRKYKRSTANRVLSDLIDRIYIINNDNNYIYRVTKAVLFGSYINSNKEAIGDLDIAIYTELKSTSINEVDQNIRQFEMDWINEETGYMNYIEQAIYGRIKMGKYLKNRSPLIELHDAGAAEQLAKEMDTPCYIYTDEYKIIYPEE
jgi:predicted nucleotidyltransferase